jgi:hypothetical protein
MRKVLLGLQIVGIAVTCYFLGGALEYRRGQAEIAGIRFSAAAERVEAEYTKSNNDILATRLVRAYQDFEYLYDLSRVYYPVKPATVVDIMNSYQSYIIASMERITERVD